MLRELKTEDKKIWGERVAYAKGSGTDYCGNQCKKGGDSGQGEVYAEGSSIRPPKKR
jgi:hypothetical protein